MTDDEALKAPVFKLILMGDDQPDKSIQGIHELEAELRTMQRDEYPRSVNLLAPNGDILTIALGAQFGFVQHEDAASTSPTCSMAVDRSRLGAERKYREVDAGGTPTPIPEYACLPPEQVIRIVLDYAQHLKKPSDVDWQPL